MNRRITSPALALGLGLSLLVMAFAAPANANQKVPATVRVVTTDGKILVDKKLRTGTTNVPTSSRADCFGPGSTNGSKRVPGPTALGLLTQAARSTKTLRPLLVTNAMDFGLGVCGIGGVSAPATGFWLIKYNHANATVGAEGLNLKRNDDVLFYLVQNFEDPTPGELFLRAPAKVKRGKVATVRVFEYDDKGKRRPAAGVRIANVKAAPTNARGITRFRVTRKVRIAARGTGLIPSNRAVISIRR